MTWTLNSARARRRSGAILGLAAIAAVPSSATAQKLSSNNFKWDKLAGQANDIGVARDNILWIVNNATQPNGEYQLYTWNAGPANWVDQKVTGVRLFAESGSDAPYILKANGEIWRRRNGTWEKQFGALNITSFSSAGRDTKAILPQGQGEQFMIGKDPTATSGGVSRLNHATNEWMYLNNPARMKRVAADHFGNAWTIDENNYVWAYDPSANSWTKMNGTMGTALAVGGSFYGAPGTVQVYLVGTDRMLYKLVRGEFVKSRGDGKNLMEIAADSDGNVWAVTADRQIFKGTQIAP